jgi:hypothetical protein
MPAVSAHDESASANNRDFSSAVTPIEAVIAHQHNVGGHALHTFAEPCLDPIREGRNDGDRHAASQATATLHPGGNQRKGLRRCGHLRPIRQPNRSAPVTVQSASDPWAEIAG